MKKILWLQTARLTCVITLTIASLPSYLKNGQAQTPTPTSLNTSSKVRYAAPSGPRNPGTPRGRGRGGGSRGLCKQYASLTALVPETQMGTQKVVWGQSASQNPKFWFFVPEKLTSKLPVEFVLQDEADNYIYKTKFNPPETPAGIVSLTVKPTVVLQQGKSYNWTFSIYCDPDKPSTSVYVRGSVTQIAQNPTLQRQLQTAKTPIERAAFYANNGIWYDALTTLGEQIQNNQRKDAAMTSAWNDLLKQVNLSHVTAAPIVPCCQLKE
ncbi:hypothetical protein BZZ01_19595 [Nostocales cyanobacterium HT-58-2]|nr:hypothetical protein BZZ01_19595 [Nostocales cyanobacterium HT-58-2]